MNLARERLLLDECLSRGEARLYTWTSWPSLVVGRLSREGLDYNCKEAERLGIPVFRRHSGGGPVLHGPGVLAVTIIAPADGRVAPTRVYEEGVSLIINALSLLGVEAGKANEGDIVVAGFKVGGSAALIRHDGYLYHAVLTVDEPLEDVKRLTPPRVDRIEKGEVDPVKYNPKPLADINPVDRKSVMTALEETARRRGLQHYYLHSLEDPCVEATADRIAGLVSHYAATAKTTCPSSQQIEQPRYYQL